jgi:hypothetical protein
MGDSWKGVRRLVPPGWWRVVGAGGTVMPRQQQGKLIDRTLRRIHPPDRLTPRGAMNGRIVMSFP